MPLPTVKMDKQKLNRGLGVRELRAKKMKNLDVDAANCAKINAAGVAALTGRGAGM